MQQLVEDFTGEPFPDFMERAVLRRLGMRSSTYLQPLTEDRWLFAASGHGSDGSKVDGDWHVYPEMAAAGLWTTPSDLARLAIEVQQSLRGIFNRVLSRAMTTEMLTPIMQDYGLGFGIRPGPQTRFGHGGSNRGFRALLTAFHERGAGAVIMTNGDRGASLANELLRAIAREYDWVGIAPRTVTMVRLTAERSRALEGTYRVSSMNIELRLDATADGLFQLTSDDIPSATLVPTSQTQLIDTGDGTVVVIDWDGDRVVRLRTQGVEVLPVKGP